MSAWRVGAEAGLDPIVSLAADRKSKFKEFFDRVTKWIPGDVIALYVAGVTALADQTDGSPNAWLLIGMGVFTPVLVVVAAWAAKTPITSSIKVKAGLATIAFAIWTLSVPNSGWQEWSAVANNATLVAIIGSAAGILFGLVAERVGK